MRASRQPARPPVHAHTRLQPLAFAILGNVPLHLEGERSPCSRVPQPCERARYFLLRESMLDSVLVARNRFLKPGGSLFPSHARLYLAPMRSTHAHQRKAEFQVRHPQGGGFLPSPSCQWL